MGQASYAFAENLQLTINSTGNISIQLPRLDNTVNIILASYVSTAEPVYIINTLGVRTNHKCPDYQKILQFNLYDKASLI